MKTNSNIQHGARVGSGTDVSPVCSCSHGRDARATTRRPAFTLIEVMLAIAIFSVVMGAMFATWRAIIGAAKASQFAAADAQRVRVALSSLEQSLTYTEMYVANVNRYYFFEMKNGGDAYLSFVSHLPENFPRNGRFGGTQVRRVEYSIRRGQEGGNELVLRQRLISHEDFDKDEREHPLVLMKNIKSMETEVWDAQKQDWKDEWEQTNSLPKKIRIVITTENPKNSFERGDEYTRIISPASMGVQPGWQGVGAGVGAGGPAQPPGTGLPATPTPTPAPPGIR